MLFESVHRNCSWKKLWIQLWSLWQKHQSFHESDKTLDWNYKLQLFMKMKRFNFDQCGKNFAIGCNLNDHEIDSYNWIVNISFFGFGLISYFFYNSVFLKVFYVLFYSSVLCPVLPYCFLFKVFFVQVFFFHVFYCGYTLFTTLLNNKVAMIR